MEKVYLLLEKDLRSEYISVVAVYTSREAAQEAMDYYMDFHEEECSYKIESMDVLTS